MAFELKLKEQIIGYAAESKPKGSKEINIRVSGFATTEDGEYFLQVLEGVSGAYVSKFPREKAIKESQIDHLVVIVRKDKTATVYVNELKFIAQMRVKKAKWNAGDPILADDIVDIKSLRIDGVTIPKDAGMVVVLSAGWRKCVFYDYSPIASPSTELRDYDVEITLAKMWVMLHQNDRFKISDSEWRALFQRQWFPFISLGAKRTKELLNHLRASWNLDELVEDICKDAINRIPTLKAQIVNDKVFEGHRDVLAEALDNFISGKYMSASALLYPRLEGVMRSRQAQVAPGAKATQSKLSESVTADPSQNRHDLSLLLPHKFQDYLEQVYFASFDPKNVSDVSRNTVSHGVAPEKMLADKKAAVIGVLILEQIAYFCAV